MQIFHANLYYQIKEYEKDLDEKLGSDSLREKSETAALRAGHPQEIWVSANGHRTKSDDSDLADGHVHTFDLEPVVKVW